VSDHRIDRAKEHYGLDLNKIDILVMARQIAEGRSVLFSRDRHGCERHMVKHGDIVLIAVWGSSYGDAKTIRTFLAPFTIVSGARRDHYGGAKKVRRARKRNARKSA
jgi:hypothetical protein